MAQVSSDTITNVVQRDLRIFIYLYTVMLALLLAKTIIIARADGYRSPCFLTKGYRMIMKDGPSNFKKV